MTLTYVLLGAVIGFIIGFVLFRKNKDRTEEIIKKISESEERITKDLGNEFLNNRQELSLSLKNSTDSNSLSLDRIQKTVAERLESLQKNNDEKLEKMRQTVDEKLQKTLETRLSESFKTVVTQLDIVSKGLGEMQTLAVGVGDIKRLFSNIKTRGTWGEVQLNSLLEQILIADQYATNVAVKEGSQDRVEFAIKLPGKDNNKQQCWLPIDCKFPIEDYQSLIKASESGDKVQIDIYSDALANRVKKEAKDISEKYIDPPHTTDFAILYLPIEGLYAEVTQNTKLVEILQREYHVTVSGPNTIAALLNSLQMGFRTLAVEKRSSEIWSVLGTIRKEFGLFGDLLTKTQKKLHEAGEVIKDAQSKSHTISSKLNKVQNLPDKHIEPKMLE